MVDWGPLASALVAGGNVALCGLFGAIIVGIHLFDPCRSMFAQTITSRPVTAGRLFV
jgi:hypothetical protein